jgi:NAD(P)-dependent dehydrogenase (short-subunit alcohol dehydrogenase family)
VAFITGGGSGIGRAIALAMAQQGAAIAVVDLLAAGGRETVAAIGEAGGRAEFFRADIGSWSEVDQAVSRATEQLGQIGILVNAAGILDGYTSADVLDPSIWDRVIGINLTGTFLCSKRVLTELLRGDGGRIVNIASTAGLIGGGGGPAYVASKHGVVGLTRQMAVEYADRNVTINALCPGPIATSLRAHSSEILGPDAPPMGGLGTSEAAIRTVIPLGRRGTVEEVAASACFLASPEAAYITGHTLVIDGGWTAR